MVTYQPAKFGDYMHCGSEDIVILVCHVILQDHVIKGTCDLIGRYNEFSFSQDYTSSCDQRVE